jgi:2-oxoglutarate dehydrogenase complex dehydrogenase (E1) component-like enzyme
MLEILKRTYCSTFGIEFMHISNPEEKAWLQERIEGPDKEIAFTLKASIAIFEEAHRDRGLRSASCTSAIPAPSASALMAGKA